MKKLLIFVLILISFTSCSKKENISNENKENNKANIEIQEENMPKEKILAFNEFKFDTIDTKGNRLSSDDAYKNSKINLIYIWATYCEECKDNLGAIEDLKDSFSAEDLNSLSFILDTSINSSTNIDTAEEILKKENITFTSLIPNPTTEDSLSKVETVPLTIFVDGSGKILKSYEGILSKDQLETTINSLLNA